MMTLVLVPAKGEQHIKGNGWFSNGRCTVAGSWSKDDNDVVKIKFKMSFDDLYLLLPVFFDGHFDGERDALTGKWLYSEEILAFPVGKIEFRRISPGYLTVYPSIQELSDDKPRALWRFVIAAVRNDIRRDHWPWSYFSQRRDDRKFVISQLLSTRTSGFVPSLEEGVATFKRLIPADACFYYSKANLIRASTYIHR
jgi:hypothetical protein